jgi:translocation protein SEC62
VVLENKAEIFEQVKQFKQIDKIETIEDSVKLGQLFVDYKLLIPLERDPRVESDAKLKYPKHHLPARPQFRKFSEKGGFYTWQIAKPFGKLALLLTLGILIIFAFMCFQMWPMWLKIGIWYVSFYTLIVLVRPIQI